MIVCHSQTHPSVFYTTHSNVATHYLAWLDLQLCFTLAPCLSYAKPNYSHFFDALAASFYNQTMVPLKSY